MDTHPYANRLTARPPKCGKGPLHLDDRGHTGARRGEYGEEPITLHADLFPVMGREAGTDEAVVMSERLRVGNLTEAREQRGRALDLCKEEGQGLREESLGDQSGLARRLVAAPRHYRLDRPVSLQRPSTSVCLAPGTPFGSSRTWRMRAAPEHGLMRHGDALRNTPSRT